MFESNFPSVPLLYGTLYDNINETLYANPPGTIPSTQEFKTQLVNYIKDLKSFDTSTVIKRYTVLYYIEIVTYLVNQIYGNDTTQITRLSDDISKIFEISDKLSKKYNDKLFTVISKNTTTKINK